MGHWNQRRFKLPDSSGVHRLMTSWTFDPKIDIPPSLYLVSQKLRPIPSSYRNVKPPLDGFLGVVHFSSLL